MATLYVDLDNSIQQVRVLDIYPATSFEDEIQCNLSTISLQDTQRKQYEALSYVWGKETSEQPVWVNGHSCTVTKNLEIALRYLRFKDAPRTIWVDALCINQADLEERTAQVAFIQVVYTDASRVLVWLGEATDATDEAIEFMVNNEDELSRTKGTERQALLRPVYKGIHELLRRPWWSRIWVHFYPKIILLTLRVVTNAP